MDSYYNNPRVLIDAKAIDTGHSVELAIDGISQRMIDSIGGANTGGAIPAPYFTVQIGDGLPNVEFTESSLSIKVTRGEKFQFPIRAILQTPSWFLMLEGKEPEVICIPDERKRQLLVQRINNSVKTFNQVYSC